MSISRKLKGAASGSSDGGGGSGGGYVDDVFSTYVYEGNGGTQNIESGIDLAGEGGLVWTKSRTNNHLHILIDTERGKEKLLYSNGDWAEAESNDYITSINNDGYTLGSNSYVNDASEDFVSWTFRKARKFFDVVTYTGDGVAVREIPHNLGCEPGMVIVKPLLSGDWYVQHRGAGSSNVLFLNDSMGSVTSNAFNSTYPTSTSFSVSDTVNNNGQDYVAYLFAHDDSDESMIKCGSVVATGVGDLKATLGWEPQWILYKRADSTGNWWMYDTMRGYSAAFGDGEALFADLAQAESNYSTYGGLYNDGFGINSANNAGAGTAYVYMAIRRPNKPAEEFEPEELFATDTWGGTSPSPPAVSSGFPVDMSISTYVTGGQSRWVYSRPTSGKRVATNTSDAEGTGSEAQFDYMDGFYDSSVVNANVRDWMWRRAPGFFDVVAYKAYGAPVMEVPHNLGVEPEMIWIKDRDQARDWQVYSKAIGNTHCLRLSGSGESIGPSQLLWNNTSPTDLVFTVGDNSETNANPENYIAYLFASVPGISKVGSYTGNGELVVIDCGFDPSGASTKGLLIKRVDSTGDWAWHYPNPSSGSMLAMRIHLNDTSAGVRQYDLGAGWGGFRLQPDSPYNIDGAEYIYYAIAL